MPVGVYSKDRKLRPCGQCGQAVLGREVIDFIIEEGIWSLDPHFARCGLRCEGSYEARKAREHGATSAGLTHNAENCPACDQGLGMGQGQG
jgi:hypothetical protein